MAPPSRWRRPLIETVPLPYLIAIPIALALATFITLFAHADTNAAMLWSQCHAHSRVPALSRIPGLGTPICYLVSFFREALDALRSRLVIAAVLAFVGGLLAVSLVEAARVCNAPNVLIAYPTGPWLVFNLLGGAVVWEIIIIPAFLHRAKSLYLEKKESEDGGEEERQEEEGQNARHLPDAEVIAIPISITLGFILPSALMLAFHNPVFIAIWLFFPLYVSLILQLTRRLISATRRTSSANMHLESSWQSLISVYTVPVVCSILAHAFVIWHVVAIPDDRQEMTRSTVRFIEIDVQFIAWTVLYWMLVEVGWKVPLIMIASSVIAGPGAGICLGWMYRERLMHGGKKRRDAEETNVDEETPLLA